MTNLIHKLHCQVLVANIQDQVRSRLEDAFGKVLFRHFLKYVIRVSHETLVDKVEGIPFVVIVNIVGS